MTSSYNLATITEPDVTVIPDFSLPFPETTYVRRLKGNYSNYIIEKKRSEADEEFTQKKTFEKSDLQHSSFCSLPNTTYIFESSEPMPAPPVFSIETLDGRTVLSIERKISR